MGARGPGATKTKPPKVAKPNGRPPVRLAQEVYEALRAPTLRAIKVLNELLDSDDERTRLLSAKALVEFGSKPPAADPDEKKGAQNAPAGTMTVTVVEADGDGYRASTG